MAAYKVWLTVKDRYGNTKEIDGGNIDVGLGELSQEDITNIEEALPMENYIKRSELDTELGAYTTDAELDSLAITKADDIPFTADKYVSNKLGGLDAGLNVKGLTVDELLAKLLELSDSTVDEPDVPDEPEIPDDTDSVINIIKAKELPMHAVTSDGELVEIPYKLLVMSEDEAKLPCSESCFYQIKDSSGDVIESGYQEVQANSSDCYYIIALPKEVDYETMVTVATYDTRQQCWANAEKFNMISDPEAVTELCAEAGVDISYINQETHTVYVWEDLPSGSLLRYIINQ